MSEKAALNYDAVYTAMVAVGELYANNELMKATEAQYVDAKGAVAAAEARLEEAVAAAEARLEEAKTVLKATEAAKEAFLKADKLRLMVIPVAAFSAGIDEC